MTPKLSKIRGSGVRHTLPFVGRFSGTWLAVSVAAVLVASASTYLIFMEDLQGAVRAGVMGMLGIQTILIVILLCALAVFTTHRVAGPWIAVRRALQDLRNGDLERRLVFREGDKYLHGVEEEFNLLAEELRSQRERSPQAPRSPQSP